MDDGILPQSLPFLWHFEGCWEFTLDVVFLHTLVNVIQDL
jgi:hypothetical protein